MSGREGNKKDTTDKQKKNKTGTRETNEKETGIEEDEGGRKRNIREVKKERKERKYNSHLREKKYRNAIR